jgi:hypothetical protein
VTARPELLVPSPLHGEIDRGADRGATKKRARRRQHGGRDNAGALLVSNDGPVDDHILLGCASPLDKDNSDRMIGCAGDRAQHPRIRHRRDVALELEIEFAVIDAARHIGREYQQEVDFLGTRA